MTGFDFQPDRAGIEKVSTSGPAVAKALNDAADRAAVNMRRLCGSLEADDFFRFRESIEVVPAAGEQRIAVGSAHDVAFVGSTSSGWHLQEFGTRFSRPRAIIRRALRQTRGIDFKEGAA